MEQTIFIGREQEVQDVMTFARKGLAGEASVAFVTGEAGMGKTALVEEVFRRLKAEIPDLVMAVGRCNVDSASYLPFRTILEDILESRTDVQISGELASGRKTKIKDSLVSILKDVGTDVMSIFLPSTIAGIAGKGSKSLFEKWFGSDAKKDLAGIATPKDLEQVQVFGWYTRVMENIAAKFPMLLFVDDLHWADASSINLLLYLGRETVEDRLMLIGTYRPNEVASDSLLAQNKTKLGRYGAKEFPLDLTETKPADAAKARQFVHDYLLAKYQTNFSDRFEALLADRTEGNALFLTEILKNMEEKGEIVSSAIPLLGGVRGGSTISKGKPTPDPSQEGNSGWHLTREMTHIDELPEKVENAVKERIGRLEKHLREILEYASVEGDEFIAQVIAKVRQLEEWQLIDDLTEKLQNIHQLIYERGGTNLPNGDRVHEFVFKHNLIREYVYAQLPQTKNELLHAKIGECLEQLYAPETAAIAAELAIHFTQAHAPEKAVKYCLHAAQDANARYGAAEAVNFAQMGLDALEARAKALPQPAYAEIKIRLLLELAKAEENGGDPQEQKDHILAGIEYLEKNISLLEGIADTLGAIVYFQLGKLYTKKVPKKQFAKNYLEKALSVYEQHNDQKNIAETLYLLGDVYPFIQPSKGEPPSREKGKEAVKRSLLIADSLKDVELQSKCLSSLAWKYAGTPYAEECSIKALELSKTIGELNKSLALLARAKVCRHQKKHKTGIQFLKEALQIALQNGDILSEVEILSCLGNDYGIYAHLQKESLQALEKTLLIQERLGMKLADTFAVLGGWFAKQGKWKKAEDYYQKAIIESREMSQAYYKFNLGIFYMLCEQCDKAAKEFSDQLKIVQRHGRSLPGFEDCAKIALNYLLLGNQTEFKKYMEGADVLSKQEESLFNKVRYERTIAEIYRILGKLETAKNYCQQSLDWFLTNADDPENSLDVTEARLNMGKILVDMGDFQEAIIYLEKAQTAFEICQHYALGETLLYLGKAHRGLGGVIFRRQAQEYVIKALAEFQRLELRHKEQEAQELLKTL